MESARTAVVFVWVVVILDVADQFVCLSAGLKSSSAVYKRLATPEQYVVRRQ